MKSLLNAVLAAFIIAPLALASPCDKPVDAGKVAECSKCKKGDKDKAKEEGTLAECGKCKKGDKDKAKEEGTLA